VQSCPPDEPMVLVRNKHSRLPTRALALQDIILVPRTELDKELETIALESMTSPSSTQAVRLDSADSSAQVPSRTIILLVIADRSLPPLSVGTRIRPHHKVQSDIGACDDDEPSFGVGFPPTGDQLRLGKLYEATQGRRPARDEVSSIAPHVIDTAIDSEKKNYIGAVEHLPWKDIPVKANVITAHDLFTVKPDDPSPGIFRLKNRAIIRRNKDQEKNEIPSDAEVATLFCVRLCLLFATLKQWSVRHVDINRSIHAVA
jgi:hypothetical protein